MLSITIISIGPFPASSRRPSCSCSAVVSAGALGSIGGGSGAPGGGGPIGMPRPTESGINVRVRSVRAGQTGFVENGPAQLLCQRIGKRRHRLPGHLHPAWRHHEKAAARRPPRAGRASGSPGSRTSGPACWFGSGTGPRPASGTRALDGGRRDATAQLSVGTCFHESEDVARPLLAMKDQLEPFGQQRLQHHVHLRRRHNGFGLGDHVEAVADDPRRSAGDLMRLHLVGAHNQLADRDINQRQPIWLDVKRDERVP